MKIIHRCLCLNAAGEIGCEQVIGSKWKKVRTEGGNKTDANYCARLNGEGSTWTPFQYRSVK
ncbi:hypothetical protein PANT111_220081 [Pantoea brenneri]|uniref:Uncharacterized protein n=1 Tax=Pantoea brenneri TaxID=472694 RepID=A0AAX3J8M9_9GAMM|nr:hypothetical protein PANT111_220081 [Pantoea brenneri]